jgi:D-sedoheptulose 7-phosphate isomerase
MAEMNSYWLDYFDSASRNLSTLSTNEVILDQVVDVCVGALQNDNCIYWCGNGGSASDAQHLAAELLGRFSLDRRPLRSISLNTDTSVMTAIANDYGYDEVFKRQLDGLGKAGDVLFGISTSGNSRSVVNVLELAKSKKIVTISLTGPNDAAAHQYSDFSLRCDSIVTSHIQESHICMGQAICGAIEKTLFPPTEI